MLYSCGKPTLSNQTEGSTRRYSETVVLLSQPGSESGACVHKGEPETWEVCPLLDVISRYSSEGEPGDSYLPGVPGAFPIPWNA